jgi:hypothetical protein
MTVRKGRIAGIKGTIAGVWDGRSLLECRSFWKMGDDLHDPELVGHQWLPRAGLWRLPLVTAAHLVGIDYAAALRLARRRSSHQTRPVAFRTSFGGCTGRRSRCVLMPGWAATTDGMAFTAFIAVHIRPQ